MSMNVKIEIDERTADVLHARAAELGVTVSELVAELARRSVAAHVGHTAIPPVAGSIDLDWSDDAFVDLDRIRDRRAGVIS
jgi:hypothetical protein